MSEARALLTPAEGEDEGCREVCTSHLPALGLVQLMSGAKSQGHFIAGGRTKRELG